MENPYISIGEAGSFERTSELIERLKIDKLLEIKGFTVDDALELKKELKDKGFNILDMADEMADDDSSMTFEEFSRIMLKGTKGGGR